ncbi:hypothetical protein [Streptomyces sp. NPDC051218]|uniref:hypothetical protein n=1 Tax=Streptomyces sp. NPDC051218 TaxID=3365645 RepID=UPI0037A7EC18
MSLGSALRMLVVGFGAGGRRADFRVRTGELEVPVFTVRHIPALAETAAYWAEHGHEDEQGGALRMLVAGFGAGGPQA